MPHNPEPPMDHAAYSKRFLALLLAAFIALTACNINGSSVSIWSANLAEPKTLDSLLYSLPREVRSDEWLVWTPALLAQANHRPSFPVENSALGAGRSPMLMNLPTRHYSTFFRPQLWGYFLFDVEYGYSWHWNMKIFGLLAAMFVLIRKLSGGNFWPGLVGTAWIFLSSYLQWWFSCPPMLPEMLASWAFALWCVMKLGDAPRRNASIALIAGLIIATVNFSLCMYPPYQLPLLYLGAAILIGWFWKRRAEVVAPARWWPDPRYLAVAAGVVALVVIPFFIQLLPTLHLVEHTSYPGTRRATGGALAAANLFLGLVEPFLSVSRFPETRESVCESANFYPVWIAAACWMVLTVGKGQNSQRRLLWPLLACILFFTLFALCPLPAFVGRITLLSFATENRLIMPIGLGGVLLSILALREMEADERYTLIRRIILLCICGGISTNLLIAASGESPDFFTNWRLAASIALSWVIFAVYLWPLKRSFSALILLLLFPAAIHVNPVNEGLAPLTATSAIPVIESIRRADPDAGWLTFDSGNLSALLQSRGINVLSGAKTLPDLEFYHEIDPKGADQEIYNRYSITLFHLNPDPAAVQFRLVNFCAHYVVIHPANPALRKRNVRYFVFQAQLKDPGAFDLQPLVRILDRHIWIYRFKEPKPAGA